MHMSLLDESRGEELGWLSLREGRGRSAFAAQDDLHLAEYLLADGVADSREAY